MELIYTSAEIQELIREKLQRRCGCHPEEASGQEAYRAVTAVVQDILGDLRHASVEATNSVQGRQVYYMSMEYLLGRSLKNHLYNLGLLPVFGKALHSLGIDLEGLFGFESDAGLGNGGLGRLAACYMDSLASLAYPVQGYSIRYEFGIFKQKLVDGWQTELPDAWLDSADAWLVPRPEETVEVRLGGNISEYWADGRLNIAHHGYETVLAVPHDMMISGFGGDRVNLLRLWSAKSPSGLDMALFSRGEYLKAVEQEAKAETLSRVLYPADDHWEGKSLRLKQQYFMVSASVQDIMRTHLERYGTVDNLVDKIAMHINDTHPTLIIPELMRILMDDHGYAWENAWRTVTGIVTYTNHTIMSEALELWPISLFEQVLPRIFSIVKEINLRFCRDLKGILGGDDERVGRMAIIGTWEVRMANLCLVACHKVNGVSALHSRILREDTFRGFADLAPNMFTNVTNGIAHRRWLDQANPGLASLVRELVGTGYLREPEQLSGLTSFADGPAAPSVFERLSEIKRENKERLAAYLHHEMGIRLDPASIFDIQTKRLHEYKRQLLNVLHILYRYERLVSEPGTSFIPHTYIFGAKASPGYFMAKQIIRLISSTAAMVNSTPGIRDCMRVVFVEDYNVSKAELIIPAADISEQISVAGKEASGTGNMKFMLNGAITLGTLDGANIEILEAVGPDNMLVFGMTDKEVRNLYDAGYSPASHVAGDHILQAVLDRLRSGINGTRFDDIVEYLMFGHGGQPDPYMCLADFAAYREAHDKADRLFASPRDWSRMSLMNIAGAGRFAADRSVGEYCGRIWNLSPVPLSLADPEGHGLATG